MNSPDAIEEIIGRNGVPLGAPSTDSSWRPAGVQSLIFEENSTSLESRHLCHRNGGSPSGPVAYSEMLNVEEVGGVGFGFVKRILREKAP